MIQTKTKIDFTTMKYNFQYCLIAVIRCLGKFAFLT